MRYSLLRNVFITNFKLHPIVQRGEDEGDKDMTEIDYIQTGDYLIPAIRLDDEPVSDEPLGKYGIMRNRHLRENDKPQYAILTLKGELYSHLSEIDRTAKEQVASFVETMLRKHPAPDKGADPMAWVGYMENLKAQAEEIVTRELIFV